ncbi:chromatin associated protein [Cryptosporidium canis]|uniref:Chromatin associated protein n=1 Tax=Cryptosporidium canis TaxID=195482 RepID=A0A9D5DLU5_9CRYT|nr:chromatin associated protein [Cryptosporidium canis]
MTIISDASEGTGNSGIKKGRRGRPRRSSAAQQIDNSDSEGISMNDIPVENNGVVSVCNIELLTQEDKAIPDSKLANYSIEEEFVGFGVGLSACSDRFSHLTGSNSMGTTGIRLCYSGLWRKLPQNIPVRELAMSRYHIAVLLNNGHVYVTLNDMNENLYGNLESTQKTTGIAGSNQQECPESGNEQRNSINSSNTLLLGSSVAQGSWLSIKELDDKNIRGLRITSVSMETSNTEHKFGIRSFVLACLAADGQIWIVEHSSSPQGGFNNIHHIDPTKIRPAHQTERQDCRKPDNEFYRAVDIALSEMNPIYRKNLKGERVDEIHEYQDILLDDFHSFPYRYGMAITCLLADGMSNSIILMRNTEFVHYDKIDVMDLPVICRKVFCGFNAEFGLILLQNGLLWSWDRRQELLREQKPDFDPKSHISVRELNSQPEERSVSKVNLRILKGSLSERKVIDFSALNGEFIALTHDGIIHEWNDPDRMSAFKRPLIKDPIILTPKTNHFIVKKALSNREYWSMDTIISLRALTSNAQETSAYFKADDTIDLTYEEMADREIGEMYSTSNKIIGAWLLEGITLILYKDGVLKALYNYLGRDGYDSKVGFISEEDELCWNKHNSSINSCILLSARLGRCIPANPIALVGLLSNFGKSKFLSERQKQLIIQRSLVKLSLREKPVYRILACYNSIVFGILRPNAKWRPGRNHSCKSQVPKCLNKPGEDMNLSATVSLNNAKEIVQTQEDKEEPNPEAQKPLEKDTKTPHPCSDHELAPLDMDSGEKAQIAPLKGGHVNSQYNTENNSRGANGKKGSSRSHGSVKVNTTSVNIAELPTTLSNQSSTIDNAVTSASNIDANAVTSTPPTTNDTSTLSTNGTPPSTETENVDPDHYNSNNCSLVENKSSPKPGRPPASRKRFSISSQKSQHTTSKAPLSAKTRKRERRSLSKSDNKENVSSVNNQGDQSLYYIEQEDNSIWESKKLSLIEYEVEQILSIREKPLTKQKEYLIKWKVPGHPVQPTWEPEENLNGCEELLQEFLKSIKTSRSGRLLLPCTSLNKIS